MMPLKFEAHCRIRNGPPMDPRPCDEKFTDPKVFEKYMKDVHGRTLSYWARGVWDDGRTPYPWKMFPAPKPKPEGTPVRTLKSLEDELRTCASCGLIAQVGWRDEPWWASHVTECAAS